jgi:hypothetical protein
VLQQQRCFEPELEPCEEPVSAEQVEPQKAGSPAAIAIAIKAMTSNRIGRRMKVTTGTSVFLSAT